MQRFRDLIGGDSPFDYLLNLAGKGLVCADSFMPVRWWLNRDKLLKAPPRQRVGVLAKAMTTGRWELVRPLKTLTKEERLNRLFEVKIILCRETVQGMTWGEALEVLRIWEYTGQVRRGYFIEGMSGVQFIREKDFAGVMYALENPKEQLIWLPAMDPCQPWGKCISHEEGRSFMNIPGTVAALRGGVTVAVMERQGKILRIFDREGADNILEAFTRDFHKKKLFPQVNRLIVKEYPEDMAEVFKKYGFKKEMQDYVLYRN